jgi:hypothetical protein
MESQATFVEEEYGGGAAAATNYAVDDQWAQGQWVDQGWDPSQTSDPGQQEWAQTAQTQQDWGQTQQDWGQQTSDPAQGWGQQTSDPTRQQTWGDQTSDQGQWGQTSDPTQQRWEPQPQQWSDQTTGWGTQTSGARKRGLPLPALIGGGVALLALIVILVLVLGGGGGGDEPPNDEVQSDFAPRSTTEFSGDAAALLPQSVAGLTLNSQNPGNVQCAEGETSVGDGVYTSPATGSTGDSGIQPAGVQDPAPTAEISMCMYDTPDGAQTDLDNTITNLTGQGFEVVQQDEALVDQSGNQVGTLTILNNTDKQGAEFQEIFTWTNGNLSAAVGGSDGEIADQVFNELSF